MEFHGFRVESGLNRFVGFVWVPWVLKRCTLTLVTVAIRTDSISMTHFPQYCHSYHECSPCPCKFVCIHVSLHLSIYTHIHTYICLFTNIHRIYAGRAQENKPLCVRLCVCVCVWVKVCV